MAVAASKNAVRRPRNASVPMATALDDTPAYRATRQAFIDALPMPAAVVGFIDSETSVSAANHRWRAIEGKLDNAATLLDRLDCRLQLSEVIAGTRNEARFEWRAGSLIEGRFFSVAMAPLCPVPDTGPRALVTLIDRTSEVQTEKTMQLERASDPLTGLPNRIGFVEAIESRFADDGGDDYAVVAVDLLRFARVNECVGSLGGDELIITVARRLMSALRGYDLLGRTGSNEFAIIVRLVDGPGDLLHVARRIEEILSRPCRLSDFEIKVECAIGGAFATDCEGDAEKLMRNAQVALKEAKLSRRVEIHQPATFTASRRRFAIETELRRAIDGDLLDMAFQPLVSLTTGKISGFEALARWNHPDLGAIAPTEFIAVAEDSGLIIPLGRWALDRALSTLKRWDEAAGRTLPLYVGVNLSAIQVARDDIAGLVGGALRSHAVSGYRLSVELTESALVSDPDRAGRTLEALKAVDAMVAMDDFGTGFSNLASLQRLPIDTLKIDRSFVTGMLDDPDKVAIVRAVLGLAQALGMTTTAEGIETRELAQALAAMGCTTGQGWYYSAALPSDEALSFALRSLQLQAPR